MRLIDADALMPNAEYKGRYDMVTACDIANAPTIEPERKLELQGDESAIEILSELRSWFSCFDEKEGLAYHALSLAIRAIKANSIIQAELKKYDYGDFADAVMETNMSSFYKNSILRAVPIRGTSALYSALISVVNSDMSSYYISETVKDIVKEFKKGV